MTVKRKLTYYKSRSVQSDIWYVQGGINTLFRWGRYIFHMCKIISSCLQPCEKYKNRTCFSRVMITKVLPRFMGPCVAYISHTRSHSVQTRCRNLSSVSINRSMCHVSQPDVSRYAHLLYGNLLAAYTEADSADTKLVTAWTDRALGSRGLTCSVH